MRKIIKWFKFQKWYIKIASAILVAIITYLVVDWPISWLLPSRPVEVSNLPKKELTCKFNYCQKLFDKHTKDERFKITFDNVEVKEPYVYSITVTNTGEYAIDNNDFKRQFTIDFKGCDKIIAATVYRTTNKDILDEILEKSQFVNTELKINDFFLNPQESFTINIITEKRARSIIYSPRIKDIPNLTLINEPEEKQNDRRDFFIIMLSIVLLIMLTCIFYLLISERKYKKWKREYLIQIVQSSREGLQTKEEENYNG